jgi:hypothetical protein
MTIVQTHEVMCDACGLRVGHVERFADRPEPGATTAVRRIGHRRGWVTRPGPSGPHLGISGGRVAKRPTGRDLCPKCAPHEPEKATTP